MLRANGGAAASGFYIVTRSIAWPKMWMVSIVGTKKKAEEKIPRLFRPTIY